MIVETEPLSPGTTMAAQNTEFNFEVYSEEALTWEQHNAIHRALNLTYDFRTKAFVKKTYGYVEPTTRILCTLEDTLIGHIGIFEDFIEMDGQKIKMAGLGMILSLKPMSLIGASLRRKALDICAERGYSFAIGRVRNTDRVKRHLESFVWCFLDVPLIGQNTRSHSTEILAIFNTGFSPEPPIDLIERFKKNHGIKIEKEVF